MKMLDLFGDPVSNEAAAALLRNKPAVTKAVFARLAPELQARAFTVAGIEAADMLQRLRERVAEIPEGGDWLKARAEIAEAISPHVVTAEDPELREKQTRAAIRRSELVLRQNVYSAYARAEFEQAQELKDELPYYEYHTMGDDQVRPSHSALDGVVLPVDDPFWQTHHPPWEWGCRCVLVQVGRERYAEVARKAPEKAPQGARLARLREGMLETERGPVPVASDWERGREGAIKPPVRDLRLAADELRERYDPQVWAAMEQWARKLGIWNGLFA